MTIPVGEVGVLVSSLIDSGGVRNNFSDAEGDIAWYCYHWVEFAGRLAFLFNRCW